VDNRVPLNELDVWVSSDLLDDVVIELTGIPKEAVRDLVGVLDTAEDIISSV